MSQSRILALVLLVMTISASPARADTLIIPFIGVNYGGDSGKDLSNAVDSKRFDWGASFAFMGGGVFGIEGDFGYSPDFFGKTDVGGSRVFTAMGNLIVGVPFGGSHGFGIRPYGFGGVGLMQTHGDITAGADIDENSFSWDFGGGAMLFFGDRYGMRFDVRYLRTFDDLEIAGIQLADNPGKLDFTRTSFGFIFRF